MKAIITGSTGMIGNLILNHCLRSNKITEIVNLVRKPVHSANNPKLQNILINDFRNYDNRNDLFENTDMAFFCLGVYTGQVKDGLFREITVDYAVNFAKMLKQNSPKSRLCLLSGAGADRTEKSRTAFARYKGMAENQISRLGLKFFAFRPGYIYPVTPRKEPNLMYKVMRSVYPLVRLLGKNSSLKSTELAEAMFYVGLHGTHKEILGNKNIFDLVRNKYREN